MFTKIKTFSAALFCISFLTLNAQTPKWEVGGFLGLSQYQGDINDSGSFDELNGGFGILARRHLSNNFALRGNLLFGKMSGKDANVTRNASRGFTFSSPMSEISIVGEYDILGHKRYSEGKFKKAFSPYIFGGIGLLMGVSPTNNYNEVANVRQIALINQDKAQAASGSFLAVPLGLGVKIDLSEKWGLNLEVGKRYTFNDNIDRISKSANPNESDTYIYGGAILSYRFGISGAPKVSMPKATLPNVVIEDNKAKMEAAAREKAQAEALARAEAARAAKDTDGDGVVDGIDKCPTIPGSALNNGCPLVDSDGDGVADINDKCPNLKGSASNNGCPLVDTDGDGVADADDKCPNTAGSASNNGCPIVDTDGDGVADANDRCPTIAGSPANNGCPLDSDGDGVADANDRCPNEAGSPSNGGCPSVTSSTSTEVTSVMTEAMQGVQFETSSSQLKTVSYAILNKVASIMLNNPSLNLTISGHTDNVGNEANNQKLSTARAITCMKFLQNKGVSASRMTAQGYGSQQPIDDNSTKQGRDRNRRVEFKAQ
jgi:OmpA-OmpF porin, OOP family